MSKLINVMRYSWRVVPTAGVLALAACGDPEEQAARLAAIQGGALPAAAETPAAPPSTETPAPAAAPAPVPDAPAREPDIAQDGALGALQGGVAVPGIEWGLADSVGLTIAPDAGAIPGWPAIEMFPAAPQGLHRLALVSASDGVVERQATVWLKPNGVDGTRIELAANTSDEEGFEEYGAAHIDLETATVAATPAPSLQDIVVERAGEWTRISAALPEGADQLYLTVGLTVDNTHLFSGVPGDTLLLGGVEIK